MKSSPAAVPPPPKQPAKATDLKPDPVPEGSDQDVALPHERDESAHATDPEPAPVMRRAYEDLEAGLVDTDLHGTPGLDAERREELLRRQR
jgi:hypothetical protein